MCHGMDIDAKVYLWEVTAMLDIGRNADPLFGGERSHIQNNRISCAMKIADRYIFGNKYTGLHLWPGTNCKLGLETSLVHLHA